MEIVFKVKLAVTPAGKPVEELIPVTFVVAWVMVVIALLIQREGALEAPPTVLVGQAGVQTTLFQETSSLLNLSPTPNP